jgi:hypothetical protein
MTKVSTVSTVDATGATVEFDGKTQTIPWTTLRKAAEQADTELADLYRAILRDAEEMVCQIIREFVDTYDDDDEIQEEDLERIFELAYEREPTDEDREVGLWSLICAWVEE